MMSMEGIILITVLAGAALFAGITLAAIGLSKKGTDASPLLDKVGKGLGYAESIAETLKPFLPGIAGKTIDLAVRFAQKAVEQAEAAYKAALLTDANADDQRKATATSLIESALTLEGITPDDKTEKLISAVIDTLVLALPKTHANLISGPAAAAAK